MTVSRDSSENAPRHSMLRRPAALLTGSVLCLGLTGGLVADYAVHDGHSVVFQSLGLQHTPYGSTDRVDHPVDPGDGMVTGTTETTALGPAFTQNLVAGANGLPVTGMDAVDLSHISAGGGYGPQQVDWAAIPAASISIPQASLLIPYVAKGVERVNATTQQMQLPVSFQAGWLNTSAAVDADAGTTVIAGHVNYVDGSWAPMSNLFVAAPGMAVTTSNASGALQRWSITEARDVDQSQLSRLFQLHDRTGARELILITCQPTETAGGGVEFTHNHVVRASPA